MRVEVGAARVELRAHIGEIAKHLPEQRLAFGGQVVGDTLLLMRAGGRWAEAEKRQRNT